MIAAVDDHKTESLVLPELNERNLYTGKALSELVDAASMKREFALVAGSKDELEIEAIYNMEKSEWLVQVFDRSDHKARSLYELN